MSLIMNSHDMMMGQFLILSASNVKSISISYAVPATKKVLQLLEQHCCVPLLILASILPLYVFLTFLWVFYCITMWQYTHLLHLSD